LSVQVSDPRYEILENSAGPETPPYQFAKARDREEGRVVVLQMVPAALLGADARARQEFQAAVREAQTLDHPGILRVFGQGVAEGGDLYVVRELLRGITLQERIRRIAPFTLAVAADIAQAITEALVAAHRAGTAHGDLRPGHVLLSPEGQIKTADFAYGAVVAAREGEPGRLAYLAPELAAGDSSTAGDIFALGATLYEMLTGVPPLAGTTRVSSPRDVNPGVPPALDGLVRKALAPDPNARYRSASALLGDLQAVREALRTGRSLAWSPQSEKSADRGGGPERLPRPPVGEATLVAPRAETTLVAPRAEAVIPAAGTLSAAALDLEAERQEEKQPMRAKEAIRERREREPASALGRLTAAVIVLGVLFLIGLSLYFVKDFAAVPDDVQVPNLIGKTFDDAKRTAGQQHFTLVLSQASDYSDTMPENQIYRQDPPPGRTIKAEKEVVVFCSLGPRLLSIPPIVGTTQDYATRALQQASLPLGDIAQEYSDRVAAGIVIRQTPEGGSKVARNTAVNFTVSKGKQPPEAPSGAAGEADGTDKADLHWHAAARAESYTILRSLDGDTKTLARGLSDTRFTDTNLKPDTTYSYTINAVNSAGESGPSDSVLVTTQAKAPPLALPPNTVVTPAPNAGPTPDISGVPVVGDPAASETPTTARMRQFPILIDVPRRPRHARHHVQIEVQDATGTNLVYDESHDAGEQISTPIQAFGNKITFRVFMDSKLVKQQTL